MQKILYFYLATCPYCKEARRWMDELLQDPAYQSLEIEEIEEHEEADLANQYDYYYVPTYYVGGKKVHEGAATRAKIEAVFQSALTGAAATAQ